MSTKKYSTIQIRSHLRNEFSKFCTKQGYKISGLTEQLILNFLTGSLNNKDK